MKFTKFAIWFLFTLVFSVFPLLMTGGIIRAKGHSFTLEELLGTGELLAICCALSAAAIGDVIASKRRTASRITLAFMCFTVVLVTIGWYAFIGYEIHMHEIYDKQLVVSGSEVLYLFTAFTASVCVGLSD